jgi:predicted TIM-barrel fold metal-dependent hydrolase
MTAAPDAAKIVAEPPIANHERAAPTDYNVISADCHIDLIWLPPDLFTANASAEMKERMPYVTDGEKGPKWVSRNGGEFGLQNGMGSAGREYVPGVIHRSDRMAEQGLYDDGKRGVRRLTEPDLRIKDQDLDGVQGEVLFGILGAAGRLNDPDAAIEMMRIYNEWLAGFCATHPDRFAGLASIPNHDIAAAVAEIERVKKRGVLKGIEVANTLDMAPLYHLDWNPLWAAANEARLPVNFHTIGTARPNTDGLAPLQQRQAFAVHITSFQMVMSRILMEIIYGGVLEAFPDLKVVIAESGIGWIPYILDHMDLEWEDQFKDLTLTMKPSEYWYRQCKATYQSDKIGTRLLDVLGEENVMWGSDFPHPDGVWPDSQEFIEAELGHLPAAVRHKVVCANAAELYGFGST